MQAHSNQVVALVCAATVVAAAFTSWASLLMWAEYAIYDWNCSGFWNISVGLVGLEKRSLSIAGWTLLGLAVLNKQIGLPSKGGTL
jgi:hypothetical protein